MQVFNPEFVAAVKAKLETLNPLDQKAYFTREQVCLAVGVPAMFANVISIILADEEFSGFESVKSRGIRWKKASAEAL